MRRPRYGRSEGGHHPRNPRYPQQALDRPRMERPPPDPAPDSRIVRTHAVEFGSRDDSNQVEINESNHRRSKYRRLENGVSEKRYIPRYGHRGQVVPGTLNMELIFRDGDLNKEPGANSQRQWPENFLRYDDSVRYSDKSKRNFILRHQGETAFCVKRITFNQWFTRNPYHKNPINIIYGTIFICMDDDDLISRTKLYDFFQDSPSTSSGTSNDGLSLDFDPARDFHVGRPQSRRSDSVFPRVIPPPLSSTTNASIMPYSQSSPSDTSFSPPPSDAVEASTKRFSPTPSSPFEVTIDYNDHSSDDEEEVGYESVRNLTTEVRYERVNSPTDISDEDAMVVRTNQRPGRLTSIDIYRWRYRSRYRPSTSQGTAPGDGRVGSSVHREKPKNDLHPHAKFIIERGKPKVNVSFEPPV